MLIVLRALNKKKKKINSTLNYALKRSKNKRRFTFKTERIPKYKLIIKMETIKILIKINGDFDSISNYEHNSEAFHLKETPRDAPVSQRRLNKNGTRQVCNFQNLFIFNTLSK